MLEGGCIAFNSFSFMCQLIYSTSLLVLYCCCMSQQLKTTPQKHVIIMCNFGTKMCKKCVIRPSEMAKLQVCNLSKPYPVVGCAAHAQITPSWGYAPTTKKLPQFLRVGCQRHQTSHQNTFIFVQHDLPRYYTSQ